MHALHEHTSSYWGLFDFDEWLHIARPDQQLPTSALDKARDVNQEVRAALEQPLSHREPSSCLRFHPQPLSAEPDLSLDVSLHSHHSYSLLQCDSMLSWLFRALPLELESNNMQKSSQLQSAVVSSSNVGALKPAIDSHRAFLNGDRGRYAHMHMIPIWVYNFEESQQQVDARKSKEAAAQAEFEAGKQLYIASLNVTVNASAQYDSVFHTGSPARFTRRSKSKHVNHKAWYRSSKPRDDTWIHPWSRDEDFINPNIARFHHYLSIFAERKTLDGATEQSVSHSHHAHSTASLAPLPASSSSPLLLLLSCCVPFTESGGRSAGIGSVDTSHCAQLIIQQQRPTRRHSSGGEYQHSDSWITLNDTSSIEHVVNASPERAVGDTVVRSLRYPVTIGERTDTVSNTTHRTAGQQSGDIANERRRGVLKK